MTHLFLRMQWERVQVEKLVTGREEKIDRDVDRLMVHKRPNAKHCQHEEPKHL